MPMSATGRLHGFESLAERRVLLALDFVGGMTEVLSQPFTLKFTTRQRPVRHTPDSGPPRAETIPQLR
ncbi:hypothetical protein OG345_40590 (plasmid) [Streptomyces sp. NBC_01220]|uniref:hypothetical protein n=1 Tax=Streptomyces sp. NBC_01220 TaxID=2903781 RepID=UPI00352EFC42|nr:hypothetical protein OG345_40590 [Streptomyces sp. NBC_01220]